MKITKHFVDVVAIKFLIIVLSVGLFFLSVPVNGAYAKGSLAEGDSVKNVLIYEKNDQGEEVLLSILEVDDMLKYLNDNFDTIGKVHNYSLIDRYPTAVHQEAQGFTVNQFLDYAIANSSIQDIDKMGLDFAGTDRVSFWEIDGNGFDELDTYTHNSLYGVKRYNYPALYEQFKFDEHVGEGDSYYKDKNKVCDSKREEQVLLSITAFSERYFLTQSNRDKQDFYMENYFDNEGLLDTARSVRLMIPLSEEEFEKEESTVNNSRWGITYIRFDMDDPPALKSEGKVAKPTWTWVDGGESDNPAHEKGYCYFKLNCETKGATILYNDSSVGGYTPTASYKDGQEIKIKKGIGGRAFMKIRAVKEGCTDNGIITMSNTGQSEEDDGEEVSSDADVWDGHSIDTSWYKGKESAIEYDINSAAQMAGFSELVNSDITFVGKQINLRKDIHLNNHAWTPVGDDKKVGSKKAPGFLDENEFHSFEGIFNGNKHKVSGINIRDERLKSENLGFFGYIRNGIIKNLEISGSDTFHNTTYASGAVGTVLGNTTLENITNRVNIYSENDNSGHGAGIAGQVKGLNNVIKNCTNYGKVSAYMYTGGIVANGTGVQIENCENRGEINMVGTFSAGGIIGTAEDSVTIKNSDNFGQILAAASAQNVGGIIGYSISTSVEGCNNYANLTPTSQMGAIGGGGNTTYNECGNYGNLAGSTVYGIAAGGSLEKCFNIGDINAVTAIGLSNGTINASANYGTVTGKVLAVGIGNSTSISSSYNAGEIKAGQENSAVTAGISETASGSISRTFDMTGHPLFNNISSQNAPVMNNVFYLKGSQPVSTDAGYSNYGLKDRTLNQMYMSSTVNVELGQYIEGMPNSGYFVSRASGLPCLHFLEKSVNMTVEPKHAQLMVKTPQGEKVDPAGNAVEGNKATYNYDLVLGEKYSYSVSAPGYITENTSSKYDGLTDIIYDLIENLVTDEVPTEIVLNWASDPKTSQSVSWSDTSGGSQLIQYVTGEKYKDERSFNGAASATGKENKLGSGSSAKTYYEANMTNLTPGTKYFYRVGKIGHWSKINTFTTAPDENEDFKFFFFGDVQTNGLAENDYPQFGSLLKKAYKKAPDAKFGLMAGDMVQSGSDLKDWKYFLSYSQSLFSNIPMMPNIGNHESNFVGGKANYYLNIFNLPQNGPEGFEEEFYSFDYGSIHVTVLNSWSLSSEQNLNAVEQKKIENWIKEDLKASKNSKFRIVTMHHPAYSMATDTVANAVKEKWEPILVEGKVDLALVGHQHVYGRTEPLNKGNIDYGNGVTYVMGNSGLKFYSTADETYWQKVIYNESTYQLLNLTGDTLILESFGRDGKLLDSWSKNSNIKTIAGDANEDGMLNNADVLFIKEAVLDGGKYKKILDTNNDGKVDIRDAQYVVNLIKIS